MEKNILIAILALIVAYAVTALLYIKYKHNKIYKKIYCRLDVDKSLYTEVNVTDGTSLSFRHKLLLKSIIIEEKRLNLALTYYIVTNSKEGKKKIRKHYQKLHTLRSKLNKVVVKSSTSPLNIDRLQVIKDECSTEVMDIDYDARYSKITSILEEIDSQLTHKR